ncbi:MAG: hypothetical protein KatS3mg021_0479 [Fimbriimonadales bacterium]|nr:MAG: hypothetical protein KatS3mg021_0479 [Fimbriimonadales bacterium]
MSRVAKVFLVLGIVFTIVCMGICLGTVWLFTPPQLEIPPRRYPPNNAYEPLRRIGNAITQRGRNDERFKQLDQKVRTQRHALTPAERRAYVEAVRAELEAYPQYLNQPCAAIFDYNFNARFPEVVGFRTLAYAEVLLIEEKLAQGKDREAVEHFMRATLLGIQIRNDGAPLHFFVGAELTRLALRPFFESPNMLDDSEALQQVVAFVKEWESRPPSPFRDAGTRALFHKGDAPGACRRKPLVAGVREGDWFERSSE